MTNILIYQIIPPPGHYLESPACLSPRPHRPRSSTPCPPSILDNGQFTDSLQLYVTTTNTPSGITSPIDGNRDLNLLVLRAGPHHGCPALSVTNMRNSSSSDPYETTSLLRRHRGAEAGGYGYRMRRSTRWGLGLCLLNSLTPSCSTTRRSY